MEFLPVVFCQIDEIQSIQFCFDDASLEVPFIVEQAVNVDQIPHSSLGDIVDISQLRHVAQQLQCLSTVGHVTPVTLVEAVDNF